MPEIQIPRDIAFMVRNRLKIRKIPYKESSIDRIILEEDYVDVVEQIISELRRKE
jgi:hypothetical protein